MRYFGGVVRKEGGREGIPQAFHAGSFKLRNSMKRLSLAVSGVTCWGILGLLLMVSAVDSTAQGTTGTIAGRVLEVGTGEPLAGAQVILDGTTMGAATDAEGYYRIINVAPGSYDLRATYLGFQTVIRQGVEVSIGLTTRENFQLREAAIEGEEVVVTAERPLIQRDQTSSMQVYSAEEIQGMPVESMAEVMEMQAGISVVEPTQRPAAVEDTPGDGLHVRGGRENETAFLIDGVRVDNPLWGGALYSQNNFGGAIDEMMTILGTFNAEYGGRMSGVINMVTTEGRGDLRGEARFYTDKFGIRQFDRNTFQGEAMIAGPVPGFDRFQFVASVQGRTTDGRFQAYEVPYWTDLKGQVPIEDEQGNPIGTPRSADWKDEVHSLLKLSWRPLQGMRLTGTYLRSQVQDQRYRHRYRYVPYGMPWRDQFADGVIAKLVHQINNTTFYEAFASAQRIDFWSGVHKTREQRIRLESRNQDELYGFEYSGGDQSYRADSSRTYQIGLNVTSQLTRQHQLKVGYDYRLLDLFHRWETAWTTPVYTIVTGVDENGDPVMSTYHNHRSYVRTRPTEMAAFIQDKMEFETIGMVVNMGLRWERWHIPLMAIEDPEQPTQSPLHPAEPKMRLSPRLGVSYPVSDRAAFHFAYGHFYQYPNYVDMMSNINQRGPHPDRPNLEDIGIAIFNAEMEPEKSVTYEAGLQYGLGEGSRINVTAYYRSLADLIGVTWIQSAGYVMYENRDYGNSKGLEVALSHRVARRVTARLNYTWSQTLISSSSPVVAAQTIGTAPLAVRTHLADWDRPHDLAGSVSVRLPNGFRVSSNGQIRSGRPYTVLAERPNTERMPTFMNVNGRVSRDFNAGRMSHRVYLQVHNVFDRQNIHWVYPVTGRWDDDGDPGTPYASTANPTRLSDGRRVRIGYSISF
jgi:outer membrane receptor for ferrienterochelin and colicin